MTYKEAREYLQPVADSTPLAGYGAALSKAIEALEKAEQMDEGRLLVLEKNDDPMSLDSLSLFLQNRAPAAGELNEYDKILLQEASGRFAELALMEHEGRLLVLPCKVGDILYYFPKWYAGSGYEPEPISVEEVNSFNGNIVVECYLDPDTRLSILPPDFGKTVFLTREEAEAALKGEGNG